MNENVLTLREKINAVAQGLLRGDKQLYPFIIFLVLLIFLVILIYWLREMKHRKKIYNRSKNSYNYLIRKFDLTIRETDLLDKMSMFLLHPKKKYILLLNKGTFSHALKHLNMVEEVPESIEKSLEKKLGFSSVPYTHRMRTTSDIFKGAPITVWDGTNGYFTGHSEGRSTGRLTIKLGKEATILSPGDKVTLFTYTYKYLATFVVKVYSVDKDLFSVSESEATGIDPHMKINLPVYINSEGMENTEQITEILRISPKGVILRNPGMNISRGDDIRISFHAESTQDYHLNGEVEGISLNRKYIKVGVSHVIREK